MYFGDWSTHFGLADEAFSPDPAAHPIIHTHQGNWPRVFTFILFALGARSAESQIIIHVFTVGLAAIWLMHRFLNQLTNSWFATVACLTFMSDYILFAQWQVVTYRIWHVFFVFASLNCMHEIDGSNKKWKIAFILNFAAMYYGELVFAFYVSVWSLLYYFYLSSWNIFKVLKRGLLIAVSGMVSLSILFTQLSLYMGYKNAILDFSYTLMTRNSSGGNLEVNQAIKEFYEKINVVFWNNIVDASKFRTIPEFFSNIFTYGFQVHTPILSLQALFALLCILICSLQTAINKHFVLLKNIKINHIIAITATTISIYLFMRTLFFDNKLLGVYQHQEFYAHIFATGVILLLPPSWLLSSMLSHISNPFGNKVSLIQVILINSFIVACAKLVDILPTYYLQHFSIVWFKHLSDHMPTIFWQLLSITLVFTCALNIALNQDFILQRFKTKAIFGFLAAAIFGYAIVYVLSPGYIFSGYLSRNAPFIVFFIDVIMALLFWYIIESAIMQFRLYQSYSHLSKLTVNYIKSLYIFCLFGMLCLVSYQWVYLQYKYYRIFPPTSFLFIKELRKPEFKHKSIITNQYPLPFSYEAHNWAYNGTNYGAGALHITDKGYAMQHDIEYFWYRNKSEHPAYMRPDYYVCFNPHSFGVAINEMRMMSSKARWCSNNRVVSQAIIANTFTDNDLRLRHTLIKSDMSKYDSWSIVKMDWDFPPYLAKQSKTRKHFTVQYNYQTKKLSLNYIFKQQDGVQESFTKFKILERTVANKKQVLAEFTARDGKAEIILKGNPPKQLEIIGVPYTQNKKGLFITEIVDIARQ